MKKDSQGENSELVSVIIPVYNEEVYLKECIESVLKQTYTEIELILVDDGSINKAGTICDEMQKKDNRIQVIHQENKGLSQARISGVNEAKGEWIMFVDNDDLVSPYIVEDMIKCGRNEKVDIVAGKRVDLIDVTDYKWEKKDILSAVYEKGMNIVEKIPEDGQKTIITPMWGKIYRKDFLKGQIKNEYKTKCNILYF